MKTIPVRDVIDGKTIITHTHDPECTGCEHECPWGRHHFGAPYCPVCDDHAEAADDGD